MLSAANGTVQKHQVVSIGPEIEVVLIPGAAASAGEIYLGDITDFAHSTGHRYYFSGYEDLLNEMKIPYDQCLKTKDFDRRSLIDRSEECIKNIKKLLIKKNISGKKLLLLGHSMGGNIARLVAADESVSDYVHTVMTISTPHKGTLIADYAYTQFTEGEDIQTPFYKLLMRVIDFKPNSRLYFKEMFSQRVWGQETYRAQDVEDNKDVHYYSISNYTNYNPAGIFHLTWTILKSEMKKYQQDQQEFGLKSDGIIPTFSMIHGKHLGMVKADHVEGLCIGVFSLSSGCRKMKEKLRGLLTDFRQN